MELQVGPAEVLEGPVDLGLDRPHLDARELGDLPELEVLEAEEDQDLPLLDGQAVEGPADELRFPVGLVGGRGKGLAAQAPRRTVRRGRAPASAFSGDRCGRCARSGRARR
ncbi:MAG: hypothetical protein MZV64_52705 [Ignavibacteriales bacterium]|nr:hypothetical protein [Ignavibacteriales bacterium]